jgi:hypothetical protein
VQWFLAKVAALKNLRARRAPPQIKIPRRPKLATPRPRWSSAWWQARLAARSSIPLDDFLSHRLSRHMASLPVPPSRLPVLFSIDEFGTIHTTPNPTPARRAPWLDSFLRAEGPSALGPEIQLAQADVARLAARIESQRKRVDESAREMEEATRGAQAVDPGDEAQAEQAGRPPVPLPIGIALQLFALALLLAETWQLAVPSLEAAGIHAHDLATEIKRNPVGLVLGLLFALGASASLFLFAHIALKRGLELFEAQPETRRRSWIGATAAAASLLAAAMAWSIAGTRPGADHPVDLRYAQVTLFFIALSIPITTAWLVRVARGLEAERAEALTRARAWDQEHYRAYSDLSRRAGLVQEEERRLLRLEADRATAVRRLRALQQRSIDAQRLAADAADEEDAELARLAQAITACLELDRYEFVRQAGLRGLNVERVPPPPAPSPVRGPEVGQTLLAG